MSRTKPIRALGLALALMSTTSLAAGPAFAQVQPGASTHAASSADTSHTDGPRYVYLDQLPEQGRTPLATRYQDFSRDTPAMAYGDCLAAYGEATCHRIAQSNGDVCSAASDMMTDLHLVDGTLADSDDAEQTLLAVYNDLPKSVKAVTAVKSIADAVGTGALCILSFGLYCIAAIANGVHNELDNALNAKLELASIRLAIANIVVTRANIRLQQVFIRATGLWMEFAVPACERGGYGQFVGSFQSLPAYNNPIPDFVVRGH